MWLNRNTKVLESVPTQKWEVNACSIWSGYSVLSSLTISPVSVTSTNDNPIMGGKRIMDCTRSHVSITAQVNCNTCTFPFPKQTAYSCIFLLIILYPPLKLLKWSHCLHCHVSSSKLINLGLSGPNWKILFVTEGHSVDFFIHILEHRHCLIILVIGYKDFHSPIQTSIVIKICTNTIEISLNSFVTKGINRVTAKWEIQFNR